MLQIQCPCELKLPRSCPSTVSEKSFGRTENFIEENVYGKVLCFFFFLVKNSGFVSCFQKDQLFCSESV